VSVTWAQYRRARRRSRQALIVLAAAALSVLLTLVWFFADGQFRLGGGFSDGPSDAPVLAAWMSPIAAVRAVPTGRAADLLESLPVRARDPAANYDRAAFGQAWLDVDRNGCDTRNDILRRDLADPRFTDGSRCRIGSGSFREPYTGRQTAFRRGAESSKAIQIDHVVALGDAWQTGAQQLTALQRTHLANDPLNLVAADGPANQDKSSSDAAGWLPSNKAFRCHYVARQVSVKAAYALWVTAAEKDAIRRVLGSCPDQATIRPTSNGANQQ